MNKRVILIIVAGLLLCSCEANMNSEKNISESGAETTQATSIEADVSETEVDKKTAEQVENENVTYNLFTNAVKAEDIYDVKLLDLPERINDMDYFPCGILDDKILVVIQKDINDDSYPCEYGLLDCNTKNYEQVIPSISNSFIESSDNQYFVFRSSRNDNTMFFQIYNTETNKFKIIFNFTDDNQPTNNRALLSNGKVYFDCYTSQNSQDSTESAVYEYDIATDALTKVADHAHTPMVTGNEVWYVNYDAETKMLDKISNHTTGDEIAVREKNIAGLACAGNRVFAITSDEAVDPHKSSDAIAELKTEGTNRPIIATQSGDGEIFDTLVSNNFCVAWGDNTADSSTPCVYDTATDTLVYFDCIENCYYSPYLGNDVGMLFDNMNFSTTHQVCVFGPKES